MGNSPTTEDKVSQTIERKLKTQVFVHPITDCWYWMGGLNHAGYGLLTIGRHGSMLAHCASYESVKGKVPEGLELDHKCRVRCCVNPMHLEAVTHQENCKRGIAGETRRELARSQHQCKRGHWLFGENLYRQPKTGYRVCKACSSERLRNWRKKHDVR